jgi:sugar lactone lactonase YvrE
MQAPGDPVVQTLARFGEHASCEGLTVDRAGNIYAAVRESEGKPLHMLQLKQGSNELVQLPVRLDKHVYSIAISPSGQELYVGQMMAGFWST